MFEILSFSLIIVCPLVNSLQATVNIRGGTINGNVKFTQGFGKVLIQGTITGLPPGQHGFHIHQFGDLSNGCTSTGAHFNPFNTQHGGPLAFIRHVGDLGNIVADATGKASISFEDDRIRLYGFTDIIGRAVVVHAGVDDLGLGGNADSLTTGNAGARLGCGVIGRFNHLKTFTVFFINCLPLAKSRLAIVNIKGPTVSGNINFTQTAGKVLIKGEITGLTPGQHGFHIHKFGDLSNDCASAGILFNPVKKQHGSPSSVDRHIGDLDKIVADSTGKATIDFENTGIRLFEFPNIIGRAAVVHDLGNADSLTTGSAGAVLGCGVIGRF